ncbi:hypothetical protein Tco_1497034, partial [Tanacetum coccineum]
IDVVGFNLDGLCPRVMVQWGVMGLNILHGIRIGNKGGRGIGSMLYLLYLFGWAVGLLITNIWYQSCVRSKEGLSVGSRKGFSPSLQGRNRKGLIPGSDQEREGRLQPYAIRSSRRKKQQQFVEWGRCSKKTRMKEDKQQAIAAKVDHLVIKGMKVSQQKNEKERKKERKFRRGEREERGAQKNGRT